MALNGNHAEIVSVPHNLCAKNPDNVGDEAACFTVIGAIALQGIRLAGPTLGETFVVTGLWPGWPYDRSVAKSSGLPGHGH